MEVRRVKYTHMVCTAGKVSSERSTKKITPAIANLKNHTQGHFFLFIRVKFLPIFPTLRSFCGDTLTYVTH